MDFLFLPLTMMPPQPCADASELIISSAGGEIKDFPLYALRFFIDDQCSSSHAWFDRLLPLEKIWKSFPEFTGAVKPCTAEVLEKLLLLWTNITLSIFSVP